MRKLTFHRDSSTLVKHINITFLLFNYQSTARSILSSWVNEQYNITFYLIWTLWQGNICYNHRWSSRKKKVEHPLRSILHTLFSCCCRISSQAPPSSCCKLSHENVGSSSSRHNFHLKDYNQTICFSCLLIFAVNCKYFLYCSLQQ